MYKLLLFLKKTKEEQVIEHFNNYTLKYLSELMGKDIKSGEVESNLLLEEKYSKFCEVSVSSKDEWDKLMNSKEGKALNKDMADFHQSVTAIFVNYEGNK